MNQRCRLVLEVLGRALAVAEQEGCELFCVCGDLFDSDRPEPQLIAAVQDLFAYSQARYGMRVILLLGNHEATSDTMGDHSLAPLRSSVTGVVDCPMAHHEQDSVVLLVPYQPGPAVEYISVALEALWKAHGVQQAPERILLLHTGIRDKDTAPWLKTAVNSIDVKTLATLCVKYKISKVASGDWHTRKQWDGTQEPTATPLSIVQLGALCPTGFQDAGYDGLGVLSIFETGKAVVRTVIIPGPRFIKTSEENLNPTVVGARFEGTFQPPAQGWATFVSWTRPVADMKRCEAQLAHFKSQGLVVDGEVLADEQESVIAARTAAQRASSADTLEDALAGYVSAMALAEGVDRAEVHRRSREYLEAAGTE